LLADAVLNAVLNADCRLPIAVADADADADADAVFCCEIAVLIMDEYR